MIKTKEISDFIEGSFKTIEKELLRLDTKVEIEEFLKWTLEKLRMNYNFTEEEKLLQELRPLRKLNNNDVKIKEIADKKKEFIQRDKPYILESGDIINIKFGIGIGHELSDQHYGVILSTKGTMFLIAPLTSQLQNYGKNTKSFKGLNLPRKDGLRQKENDISYISFAQIRYIHCRRITKIKAIKGQNDYQEKRTVIKDEIKDILNKWNAIISEEIG